MVANWGTTNCSLKPTNRGSKLKVNETPNNHHIVEKTIITVTIVTMCVLFFRSESKPLPSSFPELTKKETGCTTVAERNGKAVSLLWGRKNEENSKP